MCTKKSDDNYYRCDKADCSENRRKRRANKEAMDAVLNDEDLKFLAESGISQMELLDPDEEPDNERDGVDSEINERIGDFMYRYCTGETITTEEGIAIEKDLRHIGGHLSREAETLAGVTAEEIHEDWGQRYDALMEEYEDLVERTNEAREKLDEEEAELNQFEVDEPAYYSLYHGSYIHTENAYNELLRQQNQKYDEVMATYQWTDDETQEKVQELAKAYRTVIAEEREMGGVVDAVGDNERGYYAISDQIQNFPASWVTACNESGYELHIEDVQGDDAPSDMYEGRSSYTEKTEFPDENGRLYVGAVIRVPEEQMGTVLGDRKALHEYTHHIQSRYGHRVIERLEEFHILNRIPVHNGEYEQLSVIAQGSQSAEYGYRDHFVDHYMGTVKDSKKYFEVMTTGMEALFKGSYRGLVHENGHMDHEMRNFVLGVLAKI